MRSCSATKADDELAQRKPVQCRLVPRSQASGDPAGDSACRRRRLTPRSGQTGSLGRHLPPATGCRRTPPDGSAFARASRTALSARSVVSPRVSRDVRHIYRTACGCSTASAGTRVFASWGRWFRRWRSPCPRALRPLSQHPHKRTATSCGLPSKVSRGFRFGSASTHARDAVLRATSSPPSSIRWRSS